MSIIEGALNKANKEGQQLNKPAEMSAELANKLEEKINVLNKVVPASTPVVPVVKEQIVENQEIDELDWDKLSELGFVTPGDSNTQTVEEFRNIKHPLVSNAFGKGNNGIQRANLILVTSSLPGEGKTFTAINLALSIANERDKKVLLIDADVARPSVSNTLGIKGSPGLIEYLEGQDVKFADIVHKTNMPGLRVIPAGKQHKHSTELLSSNRMVMLAEELSKRYPDRIVIFDSPPLLAATQAEVLAKLVGQIVLVIEAERTLQSMVMESVEKLASCDVVLAVFNKTQTSSEGAHYGYGYGQYSH
ncbi:MAG: tyrosine-protein kinase family protein [Methylococcaceae bacterium]|nr:tyrosine-protein kinase family protein [Methylococcaceae bacterium]